ncbi:MAG: hypothetical protein IK025_00475 [Bacteroidales bacterium]|nr:hypothetical protein [Bacteroidales bacterium]
MSVLVATESYEASICNLAEKVAVNAISEEEAWHCFMQDRLSELFDKASRGVENFSEDNFLTELRRQGLTPDDFPYDNTQHCYEIRMKNHTFCLFCTEFITFFSQNAYHISIDKCKDGAVNITSCPTTTTANILMVADKQFPEWEKQWPETYKRISKIAKNFNVECRTIDALVSSVHGKKFDIVHHIGKSILSLDGQSIVIDHNSFATDSKAVLGKIANFAETRMTKC